MAYTCNPSTEARESAFEASLSYILRPGLKKGWGVGWKRKGGERKVRESVWDMAQWLRICPSEQDPGSIFIMEINRRMKPRFSRSKLFFGGLSSTHWDPQVPEATQ